MTQIYIIASFLFFGFNFWFYSFVIKKLRELQREINAQKMEIEALSVYREYNS